MSTNHTTTEPSSPAAIQVDTIAAPSADLTGTGTARIRTPPSPIILIAPAPVRGLLWDATARYSIRLRRFRSGVRGPKDSQTGTDDWVMYPPNPYLLNYEILVEITTVIKSFNPEDRTRNFELWFCVMNSHRGLRYPDGYYHSPDVCVASYRGNNTDTLAPPWTRIPLLHTDYQIHNRAKILSAIVLAAKRPENGAKRSAILRFASVSIVQLGNQIPEDFPLMRTPLRRTSISDSSSSSSSEDADYPDLSPGPACCLNSPESASSDSDGTKSPQPSTILFKELLEERLGLTVTEGNRCTGVGSAHSQLQTRASGSQKMEIDDCEWFAT